MKVLLLTLDLRLPGCQSLKEKRNRVRKLRDRFGHQSNIAVFESDYRDKLGLSQWSFVIVGDHNQVESDLAAIESYCASAIDGYPVASHREYIN